MLISRFFCRAIRPASELSQLERDREREIEIPITKDTRDCLSRRHWYISLRILVEILNSFSNFT